MLTETDGAMLMAYCISVVPSPHRLANVVHRYKMAELLQYSLENHGKAHAAIAASAAEYNDIQNIPRVALLPSCHQPLGWPQDITEGAVIHDAGHVLRVVATMMPSVVRHQTRPGLFETAGVEDQIWAKPHVNGGGMHRIFYA